MNQLLNASKAGHWIVDQYEVFFYKLWMAPTGRQAKSKLQQHGKAAMKILSSLELQAFDDIFKELLVI